ncbi:MAG: anti-phage defense ZorAB system ZorA [Desulfobacterales bacterium]|nr:anti-phage defense ZorAB system ZorA [Desulfobacterales bacterium]
MATFKKIKVVVGIIMSLISLSTEINNISLYIFKLPVQTQIIAGFIIMLSIFFIWYFFIKAPYLLFKFRRLLKDLKKFKKSNRLDPSELFSRKKNRKISHLWSKYKETLHEQKRINPKTAFEETYALRATIPAEAYFNNQSLVDSQLHADFFKHLPGIFTGIGIIGTFFGLIKGLGAFHVSDNTQIVRQSLGQLLSGVSEAFIVSATAIALAMIVTIIEKILLSILHRKVEELCYFIDSLFEVGSGEEYLARIVKASEDSASQSKILKDSFVGELKQILTEITQQQISASQKHISDSIQASLLSQKELGQQLSKSIEMGITQPLSGIAEGFRFHRERSGEDLSSALTDVLAAFTQRLQDLFGGQIFGINELQQKTMNALESSVNQLNYMTTSVNEAGRGATEAMASKLTEAIKAMEVRQQLMNDRMAEFVEQIRNLISTSQNETNQKLKVLLSDLGKQVAMVVTELQVQTKGVSDAHKDQQHELLKATTQVVSSISCEMKTSIQSMQSHIVQFIGNLESSVKQLNYMTTSVNEAGRGATEAMASKLTEAIKAMEVRQQLMNDRMAEFVEQIRNLISTSQSETGQKLQVLLSDLGQQVAMMVTELQVQTKGVSDAHKDQQHELLNTTNEAVSSISYEMKTSIQSMQGHIIQLIGKIEEQTAINAARNEKQQDQSVARTEKAVASLTHSVEQTVNKILIQTSDILTRLAKMVEDHQGNTLLAVNAMQSAVAGIREITDSSVSKMNQGAETLYIAADEFNKAGKSVSGVMDKAMVISKELSASAVAVSNSTRILEGIFIDYQVVKQNLSEMIESLNISIGTARREASITVDVLNRIETSAQKLSDVQHQTDKYLSDVSKVLTETHREFASNMHRTLKEANNQFYDQLRIAISLLREGIQELNEALSLIGGNTHQKNN